jgi:hypothetical protein
MLFLQTVESELDDVYNNTRERINIDYRPVCFRKTKEIKYAKKK